MDIKLKQQLNSYGITLKKAYGQNFITDLSLLDKIVELAGVTSKDCVLEIGCGAGTLTRALAKRAKKVVGYEIDKTLTPILTQVEAENKNVEIVYKDVMKEKLLDIENRLKEDYIIVANLPYYITTPIIMKFLENSKKVKALVVMVQEEVADRFCSSPKSKDYGAITVAINLRGNAEKILRVGKEMFTPPPKIDSAVIKINVDRTKNKNVDLNKVRNVVRYAFSSRRKMLVNNLMNFYKIDRTSLEKILNDCNISLTSRAEELSAQDFCALAKELEK